MIQERSVASPVVSVLMAVYNAEAHLADALASIRGQTLSSFEFVIVDDGSNDRSSRMLQEASARDPRIRLVRNNTNRGLVESLNRGFERITTPLVARMDADDVAHPERLEKQVAFLNQNPAVGVLGTAYARRYADGTETGHSPPRSHTALRWHLLFGNVWPHPAVTFRREVLEPDCSPFAQVAHAEDYDLWVRLASRTRLATLPETLIVIRTHDTGGISAANADEQIDQVAELSRRQLEQLVGRPVSAAERTRWTIAADPSSSRRPDLTDSVELMDLFERLGQCPNIDAADLRRLRRGWIRRTAAAARTNLGSPSGVRFLGRVMRCDPRALVPG